MSRYSVAVPIVLRGAGLGNELMPLAKAQIGARVLGAELVEQPWWLNRFGYGPEMGKNIGKPALSAVSRVWSPTVNVGAQQLGGRDYETLMKELAPTLPKRFVVRHTSGMSGGLLTIKSAKPFLAQRLGFTDTQHSNTGSTTIGIHIRRGDFESSDVRPEATNVRLGLSWSEAAAVAVASGITGSVEFIVTTDASGPDRVPVDALIGRLATLGTARLARGSVLDDLRTLSSCDWIIPSISSFSLFAVFLGSARYVWPLHNLGANDGMLSIWGHEPEAAAGPTKTAAEAARGDVPPQWFRAAGFDSSVAEGVTEWVSAVSASDEQWDERGDLSMYGVVPDWSIGGPFIAGRN